MNDFEQTIGAPELAKRWSISQAALVQQRAAGTGPAWMRSGEGRGRIAYCLNSVIASERERGALASPVEDRLVDSREAASLLGIGLTVFRREAGRGNLPRPIRIGGAIRWSRTALLQWMAAQRARA